MLARLVLVLVEREPETITDGAMNLRTCTDCGAPLHACFGSCHAPDVYQATRRMLDEAGVPREPVDALYEMAFGPWDGRVRELCGKCTDWRRIVDGLVQRVGLGPIGAGIPRAMGAA